MTTLSKRNDVMEGGKLEPEQVTKMAPSFAYVNESRPKNSLNWLTAYWLACPSGYTFYFSSNHMA